MFPTQAQDALRFMFATVKIFFIPCKDNNYRPKILEGKILIYVLLLACFLRLSAFLFFWQLPNTGFFADISKIALIDNLNNERSDLNLDKLKENALLDQAALLKASDMMQKGYFSHVSPAGITPWYWFKKVGYNYKSAGENLGIGYIDSTALHQAWNESPSHKANLISNKYKEVGIAFFEGNFNGAKTIIVVQLFGTQKFFPVAKPSASTVQATTSIPAPIFKPTGNQASANLSAQGQIFSSTASGIVGVTAGDTTPSPEASAGEATNFPFLASSDFEEIKGFWPSILKFFAKDYNSLTQKIVLAFLIINVLALVLNIIIKIFVQT